MSKKAGDLLDAAGLKMGPDGKVRLRPDGKPLEITIETERTGADLDAVQLVPRTGMLSASKLPSRAMTRDPYWARATGNQVQIATWGTDRGLQPFVDPIYVFPFDERSWMAPAFGIYYKTGGKQGEKPEGKLAEARPCSRSSRPPMDPAKQVEIGKSLVKMVSEECWTIAHCRACRRRRPWSRTTSATCQRSSPLTGSSWRPAPRIPASTSSRR